MKTVLCTLYNNLYLDKGLVLYDSLKACCQDFVLYVLCMDDKCYEALSDINADNMIPIRLEDFEDEELLKIKPTRSFGEYCWTCTPSIILYVIEKYKEPVCTYIDADMCFYHNPQVLIDEMISANKSVLIVPHRFTKVNKGLEANGIYCVEFNTFLDQEDSLEVLKQWRKDCLGNCTSENDGEHFGDQKYLDQWPQKYDCVYVCPHLGAGVAPWNIQSYRLVSMNDDGVKLLERRSRSRVELIFYHFQNIEYLDEKRVKINVFEGKINVQYRLVEALYLGYLYKLNQKKAFLLNSYKLNVLIRRHPAKVDSVRRKDFHFLSGLRQLSVEKLVGFFLHYFPRKSDILMIPDILE